MSDGTSFGRGRIKEGETVALVVEGGEGATAVRRSLTPLVGRADQVAELSALLSVSPLLTLTGPPGVGKSRLAIEVAHHLRSSGSPAVVVQLGGMVAGHDVDRTVSEALGDITGGRPALRALEGSGATVVLDDCDRVLGACAETARALASRGLRVLATAREPLRAGGELVWRVPPLSRPRPGHHELASLLADSDAARLFVERAESASAAFVPLPDHADHIAEICRRLDGMPLAIELAAQNVVAYSPPEIAAHLEDPFSLLTGGVRTAHPRHHSLWACLAWGYDALSSSEQLLFERLSVFSASFGDDDALEVSAPDEMGPGEVSRVLRGLVDKSLIGVEPVGTRTCYRLLESIRRFASAKLATAGDEDEVRDRHARWCARAVEAAGDPRVGRAWLERLAPLHDDIHAALEFAVTTKHADAAIVLGGAESRLGPAEGHYAQARRRLEPVVSMATSASSGALQAQILGGAGAVLALLGEWGEALANLDDAMAAGEVAGEAVETTSAALTRHFVELLSGDASAVERLDATVGEARRLGDNALLVDALAALGRAHLLVGDARAAEQELAESLESADSQHDEVGQAQAIVGLGGARLVLGDYGGAEATLRQGLDLALALGELHAAAVAMVWLGECARLRGEAALARGWFQRTGELARSTEHPYPLVLALTGLGRVAIDRGDGHAAVRSFQEALVLARAHSLAYLLAPCLCGLAGSSADPVGARSLVDEAVNTAQRCGDKTGEALALDQHARLDRDAGNLRGATSRHQQALVLWAEIGDPARIAASVEALAALAVFDKRFSAAARLVGAADSLRERHQCVRIDSRSDEHARSVEAALQELGQAAFDAEWHKGATLSAEAAAMYATAQHTRRAKRPSKGWEALTEAEQKVAELVAQGKTNIEVAGELRIAPATVKAHLRHVFAKIDVLTRTSLAAELHGRDRR